MLSLLSFYSITLTILLALSIDAILGEAKKYHYLVGFGRMANFIESIVNPDNKNASQTGSLSFNVKSAVLGGISWFALVLPIPLLYFYFFNEFVWYVQILIDATVLYLAIGLTSLKQHAMQVYKPLQQGDLTQARNFTGYLVSRDTSDLSPNEMSRATVESMLENGHDSVIASILYYLIGGAPLVILHRFANTLDAMWGYKTSRYNSFGYISARFDDVLGFVTGKLCVLLYALQGRFLLSIKNAYRQGNLYKSHNGGWVMAAGATVMNRVLGGAANYHGSKITSVTLGAGEAITVSDIPVSVNVVRRATIILLCASFIFQTGYLWL